MKAFVFALLPTFLLAGCGTESSQPPSNSTTTPSGSEVEATVSTTPTGETTAESTAQPGPSETSRTTLYGIAGLIPPHWPSPAAADWRQLFDSFEETGPLVGVYQVWNDLHPVALIFDLAKEQRFTPVVGLGVKRDLSGGGVEAVFDLQDAAAREQFLQTIVDLVSEYDISYLLLGTEIDRLEAADPVAFEGFVSLYKETYTAVKAASPSTQVFTAFQLEMLRGEAFLSGRQWQERWHLLDLFEGHLDLAAFTTYPLLDYTSPEEIPADYYAAILKHTDLLLALVELGWPSAPIPTAPTSAYGGDPQEPAAFVSRFAELTADLDVRLALWSFS